MKLEKFKNIDKKKRFIIIFTVCCVFLLAGVFLYTSFATFTEEKQFNVINGQVQDPGDLYFAVYIDGQITNTFPKKDDGYSFDASQSSCTNGATVSWDNDTWSAAVNFSNYSAGNMSRTKCTMYFKEATFADAILACDDTAANCIKDNASLTDDIASDFTGRNARYIGADPNNYVTFNNELWRIIGSMDSIDDGNDMKERRLKIIREQLYSESIAWDTTPSNDWSVSSLQKELNTTYLNSIQNSYQEMVSNAVWNLGGASSNYSSALASDWYSYERGTNVYSGRPTTWTGKIGLMYPSDYGFAATGIMASRTTTCLEVTLSEWYNYENCYNNNWLYKENVQQWALPSYTSPPFGSYYVTYISTGVDMYSSNSLKAVSPVLYLSSNVQITGGSGTSSDPYQLSL